MQELIWSTRESNVNVKELPKYNSFYCPSILIAGMDNLIERWPGSFNHSRILFFAASYACQDYNFSPKNIIFAGDVKKKMIRITKELDNKIIEILNTYPEHKLSKTVFYTIALSNFLERCDRFLDEMNESFLAEGNESDRGLMYENVLENLFLDKTFSIADICEEKFNTGDKTLCVTTRKKVASALLCSIFKDDELHPRHTYKI